MDGGRRRIRTRGALLVYGAVVVLTGALIVDALWPRPLYAALVGTAVVTLGMWRLWLIGVDVSADGATIHNLFVSHRVAWPNVARVGWAVMRVHGGDGGLDTRHGVAYLWTDRGKRYRLSGTFAFTPQAREDVEHDLRAAAPDHVRIQPVEQRSRRTA
jgi:hypothetical protein